MTLGEFCNRLIKYQGNYSHSLYYLHNMIGAGLTENLAIIDLLRRNEKRLARARDGTFEQLLPSFR